jgi:hypothetical protein
MGIGVASVSDAATGLWQRLINVAVGYVLVTQTIFVGLAGAELIAGAADRGVPVFELCLNGGHHGPALPTDAPRHDGHDHCALCFAGAYQALAAPVESPNQRVLVEGAPAWRPPAGWPSPRSRQFAIARPRGPPLSV